MLNLMILRATTTYNEEYADHYRIVLRVSKVINEAYLQVATFFDSYIPNYAPGPKKVPKMVTDNGVIT